MTSANQTYRRALSRHRPSRTTRAILGALSIAFLVAPGLVAQGEPEDSRGQSTAAATSPAATPAPIPASRQANHVVVITIKGPIDRWTSYSVQRRIKIAEDQGADAIVIDLNTPGGEIGAILEITHAIKASSIPNIVAWVNPMAYSGGAIIALSCREIVVNDPATMGDAAPIAVSPVSGLQTLGKTEREKLLAPLIAELVDSARRNGYDEMLVQAFVVAGIELWMVENIETGQRIFVDESEYALLFDGDPPRSRVDVSAADFPSAAGDNLQQPAGPTGEAFRLASSTASDELAQEVSQALHIKESVSHRPNISGNDRGKYRLIGYATSGHLLTLTTKDLHRYGFAKATVHDDQELEQFFGANRMTRLKSTWSEHLARFLSSFIVKGFLVAVFLLALFMEMAAPGIGLAGGVALFCLGALVAPQFLVGAAAWWGLASIGSGLVLMALELFIIPGFGVPGVVGIVLLLFGLLGVIVGPGGFSGPGAGEDIVYGAATLLLSLFTAGVGIYFVAKNYESLPLMNRLILKDHLKTDDDPGAMLEAMGDPAADAPVRIGDLGVAVTPLRPAGTAEFDDRLVDVVCEFGFVESGQPVQVTSVGRFRITVELTDASGTSVSLIDENQSPTEDAE